MTSYTWLHLHLRYSVLKLVFNAFCDCGNQRSDADDPLQAFRHAFGCFDRELRFAFLRRIRLEQ